MDLSDLTAVLALQHCNGIGDITAKKLIQHCGSAKAVFEEKKRNLLKIGNIGEVTLKNLYGKDHFAAAEKELEFIQSNAITPLYFTDKDYPERLKHCIDGPILLFAKGNVNVKLQHTISIVGTRQITSYGTEFCKQLVEELSVFDLTIVSGLAYGVDICAQRAAIKYNLQTIGCLAHGLNQIYPKAHQKYAELIQEKGGFVTDFWSTDQPERNNFLRRNRIIAGLSEATIVIESAEKGGSLVTADIAHSYNREVFAVPGRATDVYSKGCNNLIKHQKAQMITSAADLIYLLGWDVEDKSKHSIQKQLFVDLEATEQKVYDYLQQHGRTLLDNLSLDCDLPVHKLSSILLNMEMKGVVRPLPGKLFEVV